MMWYSSITGFEGGVMKVYITKYALTQGIYETEAEECGAEFKGMIRTGKEYSSYYHGEGKDWHRTREGAIKRAEEMRERKIQSLRKQIQKLENLKFE